MTDIGTPREWGGGTREEQQRLFDAAGSDTLLRQYAIEHATINCQAQANERSASSPLHWTGSG